MYYCKGRDILCDFANSHNYCVITTCSKYQDGIVYNKPELFSSEKLNDLVEQIQENCKKLDCENCEYQDEIQDNICKVTIIMDL